VGHKELAGRLADLLAAAAALSERWRYAAEEEGPVTAGHREVLRELALSGPQTVPQLARARSVSRQNIQILTNALLKEKLVAREANPAHQRSHLIRLTPRGRRLVEESLGREERRLRHLEVPVTRGEVKTAVRVLRAVCTALEGK
jgi:DNA-binding MarR family transcriptional regulator